MDVPALATVADSFVDLPDPRTGPAVRHELLDVVTIAVCAVLCGADTWVDVELFGRSKEPWLRTFLTLPHGVLDQEVDLRLRNGDAVDSDALSLRGGGKRDEHKQGQGMVRLHEIPR